MTLKARSETLKAYYSICICQYLQKHAAFSQNDVMEVSEFYWLDFVKYMPHGNGLKNRVQHPSEHQICQYE